jgi:hypothetical protein
MKAIRFCAISRCLARGFSRSYAMRTIECQNEGLALSRMSEAVRVGFASDVTQVAPVIGIRERSRYTETSLRSLRLYVA